MKIQASQVFFDSESKLICCALDLQNFNFPLIKTTDVSIVQSMLKKYLEHSLCVRKTMEEHKQFALDNTLLTIKKLKLSPECVGLYSESMDYAFKRIFLGIHNNFNPFSATYNNKHTLH